MLRSKENKMDYITIDKESAYPYHQQIYQSVKEAIQSKRLLPGDKLATEEEICHLFDVSRPVVRQAYNKLIEEELIERHKGKGSFVCQPKKKYTILQSLSTLTEQISMNDMHPTIKEYIREVIDCPSELFSAFNITESIKIIHLKRIYLGDNLPQFYVEAYMRCNYYDNAFNDLSKDETVQEYTKKLSNYDRLHSRRLLTAIKIPPEVCEIYKIPKNSVGFKIESFTILTNGEIADYSVTYLQGLGTRMAVNYF